MIKICETCGKEFEAKTRANQCPECREIFGKGKNKLDAKLEELHAQGLTYADAQKAETLKMIGKVNVEGEPIQHTYYEEPKPITDKDLEQAAIFAKAWGFAAALMMIPQDLIQAIYECDREAIFGTYDFEEALAIFQHHLGPVINLVKAGILK